MKKHMSRNVSLCREQNSHFSCFSSSMLLLICFSSSIFGLKWCCFSRWLCCYEYGEQQAQLRWKYENILACGGHYGCLNCLSSRKKSNPDLKSNNKFVCSCTKAQHVCLCISSDLRCADFKHMSVCFLENLKAINVHKPNLPSIWLKSPKCLTSCR